MRLNSPMSSLTCFVTKISCTADDKEGFPSTRQQEKVAEAPVMGLATQ